MSFGLFEVEHGTFERDIETGGRRDEDRRLLQADFGFFGTRRRREQVRARQGFFVSRLPVAISLNGTAMTLARPPVRLPVAGCQGAGRLAPAPNLGC